jgi:hypothetical protein
MPANNTKAEIVPLLMKECKAHGFSPFHVKKNSNGYIYNRYCFAIEIHPQYADRYQIGSGQRSSGKLFT